MPFPHGLTPAYDSGFSSSGTATPVRESSASYPPLNSMQQQGSSSALQLQLQVLQSQLQLQSSESLGAQQQRTAALGSGSSIVTNVSNGQGVTAHGTAAAHVLLVSNEPSLAAIFHQALSQAPVSSILHMATGLDLWSVIEQIKAVTGRPQGPDIVFFQPEVLVGNPGMASRVKQSCGTSCAAVVLQASESIARALQADDFLAGPSPIQPLRKEDLALVILKWRARQQGSSSSSTVSSVLSTLGSLPSAAAAAPAAALSAPVSLSTTTAAPSGGLPSGSLPPAAQLGTQQPQYQQPQLAQLQQLQAQLQALQLHARQQQQQRQAAGPAASTVLALHAAANGAVTTSEIEPAAVGQQPAVSGLGARSSPPNRPPPLRLASAGISPADALPEAARNLARASTPLPAGAVAAGAGGTGPRPAADVQELMAQVAELRRKLGDKSQVASGRVAVGQLPTVSSTGAPTLGVAAASAGAGTGAGTSLASGIAAGRGMLGAGGGAAGSSKAGQQPPAAAALGQLNQQLPGMPPAELQVKLQELQQQQQVLMQRLTNANGAAGQRSSASVLPSPAVGAAAVSNGVVTAARPLRKLENHGSMVRPAAGAAAAAVLGGGGGGQAQSASLTTNMQLQQQLLQLQQLQLQQQQHQQQRLPASAGPAAASTPTAGSLGVSPFAVDMPLSTRAASVSASGILTSPLGSPLPSPIGSSVPSPSSGNERSPAGAGADGSPVSRSNSFVAAGGTRYRPPRQRSPSPLGGTASGHLSDGYLGLGTSRLASSSLPHRSVSSNQANPANVTGGGGGNGGGGGGGSGGNGSGYNSDSFTSPDPSGSLPKLTKSGDDAIAAALSAAASDNGDGELEGSSQPSTSVAASAEHNQGRLSEMLGALEPDTGGGGGGAGGGSSVDGRSLMDASFALDDSGAGGRGSISGGAASSIDLQPSPRPPSSPPSAKAAAAAAAESPRLRSRSQSQLQPSPQGSHRSNLGATSVGSHRLASPSLLPTDTAEEDDEPLKVGPSRRPEQPPSRATPTATATATITPPQPAPRPADAGGTGAAGKSPAKAAAKPHEAPQPLPMLTPPKPHPPAPEPAAPGGSLRREQGDGGGATIAATGGDSREASPVKPPLGLRVDSLDGDRLPSIDGTKPLAAAAPAAGGAAAAAGSNDEAAALHSTAESAARPDAPVAAALATSSVAVVAGSTKPPPAPAHLGDASSSLTTTASDATADSALLTPTLRSTASGRGPSGAGAVLVGTGSGRFSEGMSVVASIEGSIAAGLVQAAPGGQKSGSPGAGAQHRAPGMWRSGSGESSSRAQSSSNGPGLTAGTPAGSGTGSAYTDDIFAIMRASEREASSSPALLQPPPRSSTPPARRAARILMCSHPIVITRDDFL